MYKRDYIVMEFQIDTGNSILSELTKSEMSKKIGHFGYDVMYKGKDGELRVPRVHTCSYVSDVHGTMGVACMISTGQ